MIRWGILSTANIAIRRLIPALQAAENCDVTALASRSPSKARDIAKRFNIPHVFDSYEDMLQSDDIDAIYIPLPTSYHVEWTIKAANAGKHVLCEKPVALHADQINALIAARDTNNVIVSEAFMVTYHPQWHKVQALLRNGAIGTLQHVNASFSYFNVDPANMRNQLDLGGGCLPDIGCYPIVATRFATGLEPRKTTANVQRDATFKTDIHATCLIDFDAFQMSMFVSTQTAWRQSICFQGDTGYIEVLAPFNSDPGKSVVVNLYAHGNDEPVVFTFSGINQYQLQAEEFARCVMAGQAKDTLFSLEDSQKNQALIDAIYASGESGRWEDV